MENKIIDAVNHYYSEKIKQYGITPKGVDWNSVESQELRFKQLSKVIEEKNNFSVLDFGCGYGALVDYFTKNKNNFSYTGFDISAEMIGVAKKNHADFENTFWETELHENKTFDYTIASGIFNVRLETSDAEWKTYIKQTLAGIDYCSQKGFSFNMLTSYSDKEFMKAYLYYADPGYFFDYCKKHFSKYVTLLHDYPLYEFTIIVKK